MKTALQTIALAAGFTPFTREAQGSLNAEAARQTAGRTHYFDLATMRFHKSRVVKLINLHGIILGAVESVACNYENTAREFRPVFVAIDGYVFERPKLGEGYKTKLAAEKALWRIAETLDERAELGRAIERRRAELARESAQLENAYAELFVTHGGA